MNLVLISLNGRYLADSREVAEMTDKQHFHLLRDIEGYAKVLTESNFGLSEFFIESTYQDGSGRTLKRYLLTKKGCDMVANKMIGEKGILFTATYVTKFEEMEKQLNKPLYVLPQTMVEAVESYLIELKRSESLQIQNNQLSIESAEQKQKLKDQETPVAIYNLAIAAHNTMSMQEVAKSLGTGRTKLFNILREEEVVMKGSTLPYQRFMDAGLFKVTERPRASGDTIVNDPATRVTAKGFDYIAKIMQRRSGSVG